jgi:hypothetical protein
MLITNIFDIVLCWCVQKLLPVTYTSLSGLRAVYHHANTNLTTRLITERPNTEKLGIV